MNFTIQCSSDATSKAAVYTDIIQQIVSRIVKDQSINAYELASVSEFTKTLSMWMDEEANKRKYSIVIKKGSN